MKIRRNDNMLFVRFVTNKKSILIDRHLAFGALIILARAAYIEVIKHKKKSKSLIKKGKSHLLTYLIRDIRSFIDLIAINGTQIFDSLKQNEKKIAGSTGRRFEYLSESKRLKVKA